MTFGLFRGEIGRAALYLPFVSLARITAATRPLAGGCAASGPLRRIAARPATCIPVSFLCTSYRYVMTKEGKARTMPAANPVPRPSSSWPLPFPAQITPSPGTHPGTHAG